MYAELEMGATFGLEWGGVEGLEGKAIEYIAFSQQVIQVVTGSLFYHARIALRKITYFC